MTRDHLQGLNDEQAVAATYGIGPDFVTLPRPLLVVAGAGSGKTRVIEARVAHLVVNSVDPARILLLTFTNRAADEVKRRSIAAIEAGGFQGRDLKWAGTFHSIALRLLKTYGRGIGIDLNFTLADQDDTRAIMQRCFDQLFGQKRQPDKSLAGRAVAIHSRAANCGITLSEAISSIKKPLQKKQLKRLVAAYQEQKKKENVLDFDDLLLGLQRLLIAKRTQRAVRELFDHVLVDEYQDTNWLQADILKKLKPDGRGLAVVGDDAQSIYSFRGARIDNILEFRHAFETKAKVVKLQRNYRSIQPILDASNAVMSQAKDSYRKCLWSRREGTRLPRLFQVADGLAQARCVAQAINAASARGIALREQAVLFRSSMDSTELELELQRLRIPFRKYGGMRLSQAAYVQDVCAILKWCQNPSDWNAGLRALKLVEGVGERKASNILGAISGMLDLDRAAAGIVSKTRLAEWARFREMVARASTRSWPRDLKAILKWYEPHIYARESNDGSTEKKLGHLLDVTFDFGSRDEFLSAIALEEPRDSSVPTAGDGYLTLSTIHSAKGREWRAVSVLSVVDGCIPDRRAQSTTQIEEERRIFYVAMTRAKDELAIYVPQMSHLSYGGNGGGYRTNLKRSPFIRRADFSLYKSRKQK